MRDVLTLGQKETIRGRSLTQRDARDEPRYCVDCLADLPDVWPGWWGHRCEIPEPAPVVVVHKTRTWQDPRPIPGLFKRHGGKMYDRTALAMCSCGWSRWMDNRESARYAAREHRGAP